jgi:hypothetical protein
MDLPFPGNFLPFNQTKLSAAGFHRSDNSCSGAGDGISPICNILDAGDRKK